MAGQHATTGEEQPPELDARWLARVSQWVTAPEDNAAFEAFRVRARHPAKKFVLWPKSAREAKGYSTALYIAALGLMLAGMVMDQNRTTVLGWGLLAAVLLLDRWIRDSASITVPNSVLEAVSPARPATQVLLDLHQAGIKGSALGEAIFLEGMTTRKHEGALVTAIMAVPLAMVAGGMWQSGGERIGFWAWLLLVLVNGLVWFFLAGGRLREAVVAWNTEVTLARAFKGGGALVAWKIVTPRAMWDVISVSVVLLLVFALLAYPLAYTASQAGLLGDLWPSAAAIIGYLLVMPPALCLLARSRESIWGGEFTGALIRADREFEQWALAQHEVTSGE